MDAKKSPLALLAQTCSQIGKSDPPSSTKLSAVASDKDCKSSPLKISDIGAEDKSSFKPYGKSSERKDTGADKSGFRVPSASCRPVTPRSPRSCSSVSPQPGSGDKTGKKERDAAKTPDASGMRTESETSKQDVSKPSVSDSIPASSVSSALGSGLVAPVFSLQTGSHRIHTLPWSIYPATLNPSYLTAWTLDRANPGGGQLINAQLSGALSSKAGSSPLAEPLLHPSCPAVCAETRFCLSYTALAIYHPAARTTAPATALKSGYPLMYPSHSLHPLSPLTPSFRDTRYTHMASCFPMIPRRTFATGFPWTVRCDKRFLILGGALSHLRTQHCIAEKLVMGYPNSLTMACHMPGAPLALRDPSSRVWARPALSSVLQKPVTDGQHAGAGSHPPRARFTLHYTLYGQRLTTVSGLGYQWENCFFYVLFASGLTSGPLFIKLALKRMK